MLRLNGIPRRRAALTDHEGHAHLAELSLLLCWSGSISLKEGRRTRSRSILGLGKVDPVYGVHRDQTQIADRGRTHLLSTSFKQQGQIFARINELLFDQQCTEEAAASVKWPNKTSKIQGTQPLQAGEALGESSCQERSLFCSSHYRSN